MLCHSATVGYSPSFQRNRYISAFMPFITIFSSILKFNPVFQGSTSHDICLFKSSLIFLVEINHSRLCPLIKSALLFVPPENLTTLCLVLQFLVQMSGSSTWGAPLTQRPFPTICVCPTVLTLVFH